MHFVFNNTIFQRQEHRKVIAARVLGGVHSQTSCSFILHQYVVIPFATTNNSASKKTKTNHRSQQADPFLRNEQGLLEHNIYTGKEFIRYYLQQLSEKQSVTMEEESTSKGGDTPSDARSPPKKQKIDEQQPCTSSGTKSTSTSNSNPSNSDLTTSDENKNDNTGEGTCATRDEEQAAECALEKSLLEMFAAEPNAVNQSMREVVIPLNEPEENRSNEEPTSTNDTAEPAEAPAPAPNNPAVRQRMRLLPNRNRQESLERLRRNMRRLAYDRIFAREILQGQELDEDESSEEEIDLNDEDDTHRVRNELVNDIAELLAPPEIFDDYVGSDNSSSDPPGDEANGNDAQAARIEDESDSSSIDSFSSGSSSPLSSGSTVSFPSSSESDEDNEAVPEAEVLDVDNLECLKMDNLKGNWDILREMRQRQHGLPYRAKPATIGSVQYNSVQFQKRAYGSVHMVQRLGLLHRLEKHSGCVNSLNFNTSGKLLASGSDDLHINLWHWESKKLLKSIVSGHRSNVFQTKFMEYKGYEEELEIISTGRDGHVRHTRVDPSGRSITELLFRGRQPIHKIAIPARNEFSFLTAGEDGKVRMYDLRQGKLEMVKKLHRPLFCIATHPYDSEFCVAGSDPLVRVYDMRHVVKPIKMLVSQRHSEPKASESVTCAVYNESGTEILASFSDDDIYLYDNTTKDKVVRPIGRFQGHCNMQTIKGVNFFGPRSEYVVSGSDCGYIYIWEKKSRVIVNWMNGDRNGAVNCLEPHPEFPILATSGVDNDVKIWVPKGLNEDQTAPVFATQDLKRYVRRNIIQRRQMHIPRTMMRLATPPISRYFSPITFRRRLARMQGTNRERSENGNSDSDMDLNEDDHVSGSRPGMLRCNPS